MITRQATNEEIAAALILAMPQEIRDAHARAVAKGDATAAKLIIMGYVLLEIHKTREAVKKEHTRHV